MKKFLTIVLAALMLLSVASTLVFGVVAEASEWAGIQLNSALTVGEKYEAILGTEAYHKLSGELYDWSDNEETSGLTGPNTYPYGIGVAGVPSVRIQTYYIPEGATGNLSVNWRIPGGNFHQAICVNYNIETGTVFAPAQGNDFFRTIYSAPVPEADRTGYIQFITVDIQDDAALTQKTYANGNLVLVQINDWAPTALQGLTFTYAMVNNDTTAWSTPHPLASAGEIVTVNNLNWHGVEVTDAKLNKLFSVFAEKYGKTEVVPTAANIPLHLYYTIFGENELSRAFEIACGNADAVSYDWTATDEHGGGILNFGGELKYLPGVRMQAMWFGAGATGLVNVNWRHNLNAHGEFACLVYNPETGEVTPTSDGAYWWTITASDVVPEAERVGYIQFITVDELIPAVTEMVEVQPEAAEEGEEEVAAEPQYEEVVVTPERLVQRTYANGKLVLEQEANNVWALLNTGIQFGTVGGNGVEWGTPADCITAGLAKNLSQLSWEMDKENAFDYGKVAAAYCAFKAYYENKDAALEIAPYYADKMIDRYVAILGEDMNMAAGDYWDWSETPDAGLINNGNVGTNAVKWGKVPQMRIQTLQIAKGATGQVGLNVMLGKNQNYAISLIYDLASGTVLPTQDALDAGFVTEYSIPCPDKAGIIQFITTAVYTKKSGETPASLVQKTYANGTLVLVQVMTGGNAAIYGNPGTSDNATTGKYPYRYAPIYSDGTTMAGPAAEPYTNGSVKLLTYMTWQNGADKAQEVYAAYADYYKTNDPWDAYRVYVDGEVVTGWYNGNYYLKTSFVDPETGDIVGPGVKVMEDKVIGGKMYYWNGTNLEMRTGWDDAHEVYYYKNTGFPAVDSCVKIGGVYYNFESGKAELVNDLIELEDGAFYYVRDGKIVRGEWIDDVWYCRASDGLLVMEDAVIGGVFYQWNEEDECLVPGTGVFGDKYYVDGEAQSGWFDAVTDEYAVKGGTVEYVVSGVYYSKVTKKVVTEDIKIGSLYYYYNEAEGRLEKRSGWVDGDYYLKASGEKVTWDQKIGGVQYNYVDGKLVKAD